MMMKRRGMLAALGVWPCSTLLAQTHTPAAAGARTSIHPWMDAGDAVQAEVVLDGKVVAKLDYRSTKAAMQRQAATTFTLTPAARRLQVRGTVTLAGATARFSENWTLTDLTKVSAPLYDTHKPWLERIRTLAKKLDDGVIVVQPAKPAKKAPQLALQDLEKRLGIQLPAPIAQLAGFNIQVKDSYFLQPGDMGTVTQMLLGEWGYTQSGENPLDKILSPQARARYDRSVPVFIEVGDGLGALAWDPAGLTPQEQARGGDKAQTTAATPGAGVWFWMHQEKLSRPELLLHEDYRPRDADAAFANVFQRFALDDLMDTESETELVVDTANPLGVLLQLHFNGPREPRMVVRSYDDHYGKL